MRLAAILVAGISVIAAQAQAPSAKSLVGTVAGFGTGAPSIIVKTDNGESITAALTPDTVAQRIAPGERDLKKAEPMKLADVAMGDRVLLTVDTATSEARRVVVMSATDISRRNDADRQDWTRRGVSGIVVSRKGGEIVLKIRNLQGEKQAVVTVAANTSFKRYAPDSVKFSDARSAALGDIAPGDQLKARGVKSEDGSKVQAEEVVFGTFTVKGGTITAINSQAGEITIKELNGKKPLVIRLSADSQVKRMPDFAAMMGGMGGMGGMPARGGPPGGTAPQAGPLAGRGMPPGMPGMAGAPGGVPDLGQMIERMPASRIEDLKPGETIVVSSASSARSDHITAILLLGNAESLLQLAASASSASSGGPGGMPGGMGMGMGGGGVTDLSSLGLGGIVF